MRPTHDETQDSSPPEASARVRRAGWIGGTAVLAVYLATMSRGLAFYDSAELALVARQLGVSHPIGQPLHTLLGALAAHLPGVPALVGLNLLSALAGAAAVPVVVALASPRGSGARDPAGWLGPALVAAPVALVALHPTVWEAATRIEVYALATVLVLAALGRGLADLDRALGMEREPDEAGGGGSIRWGGTGWLLGLGASANAFLAVVAAAALAPGIARGLLQRRLGLRALGAAALGGVVGLLPYLQVPLAAAAADPGTFIWGDPTGWDGLVSYFGGRDYATNVGVGPGRFVQQLGSWVGWAAANGHLVLLVLGLTGLAVTGPGVRGPRFQGTLVAAVLSVALIARYTVFHPAIADYVNYQALALLLAASGVVALARRLAEAPSRSWLAGVLVAAVGLLACLPAPTLAARARRAADPTPRALATAALEDAPRNAVLVASSDHLVFPLLYLQGAEGRRPDVVVVPWGLAGASWFWRQLDTRHPELPPFPLRGPGGRAGRLRRLLAADPSRPLVVESRSLAAQLGARVCGVGLVARVSLDGACDRAGVAGPRTARVTERLAELRDGAGPTADEALAAVALVRGDLLWAGGAPAAAYGAYAAGVPRSLAPPGPPPPPEALAPAAGRLPTDIDRPWTRFVPLGSPARCLYRQGRLLLAAGEGDLAATHVWRAARLGLPEAARLVEAGDGG